MINYPSLLRQHARAIEAAADTFLGFIGTDAEEHAEHLRAAAKQFREDADEYEEFTQD